MFLLFSERKREGEEGLQYFGRISHSDKLRDTIYSLASGRKSSLSPFPPFSSRSFSSFFSLSFEVETIKHGQPRRHGWRSSGGEAEARFVLISYSRKAQVGVINCTNERASRWRNTNPWIDVANPAVYRQLQSWSSSTGQFPTSSIIIA